MDAPYDCWYVFPRGEWVGVIVVSAGKEDIVDRLLEIPGTDVTIQNRNGATALYLPHPLILTADTTLLVKIESTYLTPLSPSS